MAKRIVRSVEIATAHIGKYDIETGQVEEIAKMTYMNRPQNERVLRDIRKKYGEYAFLMSLDSEMRKYSMPLDKFVENADSVGINEK